MKKIITLALIAAGIYVASFYTVKIEVSSNAAHACGESGCS